MLHFSTASDLAQIGWTEDGEPDVIEEFYVVASDEHGNQWRSPTVRHDWTNSFRFCKDYVAKQIEKVRFALYRWEPIQVFILGSIAERHGFENECELLHRESVTKLDVTTWQPWFPQYGSDAYVSSGQEAKYLAAERAGVPYYC